MLYKIENLEDQILSTLQSDTTLSGVNIQTHVGQVTALIFQDPQMMEGFVHLLPFILVQYQGKRKDFSDSTLVNIGHEITFRFFIGAESLRAAKESQRSAYSILRSLFDDLHGKFFNYVGTAYTNVLSGTQISTSGMNQYEPLTEPNGTVEQLVVNLPRIVVYQTDYMCKFLA